MNLGLVVSTLGRVESLRRLLESLSDQLSADDHLVIVAQRNLAEVEALAASHRSAGLSITVVTSPPGASRGRNAGVAALPVGPDLLLNFPNDTTWFPPHTLDRLRSLPDGFRAGALTVVDENGPKFVLPAPGTALDRHTAWTVIEMGLLIRRSLFDELGGFDPEIGTGAPTPWQAGEATDLLLKLLRAEPYIDFAWLPADVFVGGISDPSGLTVAERRRKLRSYGRGLGRLVTRWRYPLWWRFAFLGGGLFFGLRHRGTNALADGWWVFLGRLEGMLGRTLNDQLSFTAVTR
ncbi:glycosyltransferase family 2 protein [Cryobacterium sp. HLT2-28]|uniref:glycosyltransferase family 2 protein n=1 Tax=Cryobacterium sp. HLT2-28 TaxID=1259146 RepID=UPI00106D0112|nr:glycosyltransferase family A protein [Cryobacterium sp. HLT2-28]TFB91052.1 glycosyltransferase family 2 protein [Cryobacterium sp. HLT2-28]